MQSTHFSVLAAFGAAWILLACAAPESIAAAAPKSRAAAAPAVPRITILYDAFGKDAAMTKDWGYAALVEINGLRILFDTGGDPRILAKNASAKGVDLKRLDFVVLSHRHSDHVGGFSFLKAVNPSVKIYAPKENFGVFGSDLPGTFYRKDESLPGEMRYYGGKPPETMKFGTAFPGANIQVIDKTTEVSPGITLIALISDAPGTKELKELSLAINTPDGLVLVVACAHPGIEAIVAEAAKINPHIHFIAGGFHLVVAPDPVIQKVTSALHDVYKVDYIAPGHCTGEPTFAALQKAFGDRYLYAGLGTTLGVGANPHAQPDPRVSNIPSEGDSRSYRTLLAQSDDFKDRDFAAVRLAPGR
jgi:7,8-dihydropterin-6-yl-methyl-4-(beta-D-ribofuranosyl)aminobenzene 5'-phosphate synthase